MFDKVSFYILVCLFSVITGCSNGSSDRGSSPDGLPDPDNIPATKGDYSFEFNIDMLCQGDCEDSDRSERCETAHKFDNKKSYCDGLRDSHLNRGCARPERKIEYIKNCSNKFEDINVGGYSSSGGDERVGSCNFEVRKGKTKSIYCNRLKDENKHKFCRWDDRKIEFNKYECKGDFSLLPVDLWVKDEGNTSVERFTKYSSTNYITYGSYYKTFSISPATDSILNIENYKIRERNCHGKGLSYVNVILKNTSRGDGILFDSIAQRQPLIGGSTYLLSVIVENKGICRNFQIRYNVKVSN